jgi:glycosyltransferase involved in cell wall biosynthesis
MEARPKVTVITVFLNAERFIEEAIESVLAQSYDAWELLLVDDGSTDASSQIARRYAEQHSSRVRCLHHPNRANCGISASQNLGISEARGQYIAFLDADDVWAPEKLKQQTAILDAHLEAAMVYGRTRYWYSWTGKPEDAGRDLMIEPGARLDSLINPPALLVGFLRQEIPVPCPSDIMIRRDKAIEAGGFEETFRRIFTDQAFYAKVCLRWPVFVAGQSWFRYRKHTDSAVEVAKKSGQLQTARLGYLDWLSGYLSEQKIENKEARRAINYARRACRHPKLVRLMKHAKYRALIAGLFLKSIARQTLPAFAHRWLRALREQRAGQSR